MHLTALIYQNYSSLIGPARYGLGISDMQNAGMSRFLATALIRTDPVQRTSQFLHLRRAV